MQTRAHPLSRVSSRIARATSGAGDCARFLLPFPSRDLNRRMMRLGKRAECPGGLGNPWLAGEVWQRLVTAARSRKGAMIAGKRRKLWVAAGGSPAHEIAVSAAPLSSSRCAWRVIHASPSRNSGAVAPVAAPLFPIPSNRCGEPSARTARVIVCSYVPAFARGPAADPSMSSCIAVSIRRGTT